MTYPFNNPSLPLEDRLDDLVSRLSREEKIGLVPTRQEAIERLGIAAYHIGGEGAHGFVDRQGPSTSFPQTIGLAASWDTSLLEEIGRVIGREARVYYNTHERLGGLSLWFPTIDMERDPRWGRTEEAYGEDPHLASRLACAIIRGTQGDDPFYVQASCAPKHFFANNNERDRVSCSCSVDPRNRREYFLEVFRSAYTEAGALSMMTAYNEVNGIPMMCHPIVRDVVKGEWGLEGKGHIVTDGGDFIQTLTRHHYVNSHAESIALAFKNGVDTMTDNPQIVMDAVREALEQGLIDEAALDRAVRNTLRVRFRYGQFDPAGSCPWDQLGPSDMMTDADRALARRAVAESVVLLKNDPLVAQGHADSTGTRTPQEGSPLLPLDPATTKNIAVIGPLADEVYYDWYTGHPPYRTSPLDGLNTALPDASIQFEKGNDLVHFETSDGIPLIFDQDGHLCLADHMDREPARFEREDWGFGANTFKSLEHKRYLAPQSRIDTHRQPGDEELGAAETKQAPLGLCAQEESTLKWFVTPVFNIIPHGENAFIARTWDSKDLCLDGKRICVQENPRNGEPLILRIVVDRNGVQAAAELARSCDVALIFLGHNPVINGKEEIDRPSLNLPASQRMLLREVATIQERSALILVSGYPYSCSEELDLVPAAINIAHGMQEFGNGLADVISGITSPAGRLPLTWYRSETALPPMDHYDIIEPGSTYQYFPGPVLFPFGWGLSYSHFSYGELTASTPNIMADSRFSVSCTITNRGNCPADEVPQLYTSVKGSRIKRPLRSLKGFTRIHLAPGESKTVEFPLEARDFMFWDVTRSRFCLESGSAEILVGRHSRDSERVIQLPIEGESIPPRTPWQPILAETCERHQGIYLHRHPRSDDPAVFNGTDIGELVYADIDLEEGASRFEMEIAAGYQAAIELWWQSDKGEAQLRIPVPNTGDIASIPGGVRPLGWTKISIETTGFTGRGSLRLCLDGPVGIHHFVFFREEPTT